MKTQCKIGRDSTLPTKPRLVVPISGAAGLRGGVDAGDDPEALPAGIEQRAVVIEHNTSRIDHAYLLTKSIRGTLLVAQTSDVTIWVRCWLTLRLWK